MTPGARVQAAIDILEAHLGGLSVEQSLTSWARGSRFAGSKDRAAIRDHVFQAVRCRRSAGAWPDAVARMWIAGSLHVNNVECDRLFNGQGHAPEPLSDFERRLLSALSPAVPNVPEWIVDRINEDLDDDAAAVLAAFNDRAPVCLRVNSKRSDPDAALAALADEDIIAISNSLSPSALTVVEGERKIALSRCYQDGFVELQDAASQAVCDVVPVQGTLLDYCAGGGGKSLALAARGAVVHAYDVNVKRMADIGPRSERAGVQVGRFDPKRAIKFDTVFCDVPCSGSGSWRRSPEAKWALTPEDLTRYVDLQRQVLTDSVQFMKPAGQFSFATCSVFRVENQGNVEWLLQQFPNLTATDQKQFLPDANGDGLFIANFTSG
ncbi:MAG: RsmB/NOP family class I SAM-dependent RNA methyltransferase [Planktomarina sp.]